MNINITKVMNINMSLKKFIYYQKSSFIIKAITLLLLKELRQILKYKNNR